MQLPFRKFIFTGYREWDFTWQYWYSCSPAIFKSDRKRKDLGKSRPKSAMKNNVDKSQQFPKARGLVNKNWTSLLSHPLMACYHAGQWPGYMAGTTEFNNFLFLFSKYICYNCVSLFSTFWTANSCVCLIRRTVKTIEEASVCYLLWG